MRSTWITAGAAACLAAFFAGYSTSHVNASTGPIPLNCDRACLEGVMNQYLAAVVAHDPKRVPLSEDVMYTENDQVLKVGDGFWKTAAGLGNYKHYFADPEFGQVAFMGTMQEAGAPLLLSLRLRIELGRITEIESVYFRAGGGGPNNIAAMDQAGKADDMWFKSIPPAQRLSRQQMISIADGYFTGLQKNDGRGIQGTGTYPFTTDCHRIENGSPTTNVPRPANEPPDTINAFAMDCLSQFKLGYYFVVQAIHGRRYPLVPCRQAESAPDARDLVVSSFADHLISAPPSLLADVEPQRREHGDCVIDRRTVGLVQAMQGLPIRSHPGHGMLDRELEDHAIPCVRCESRRETGEIGHVVNDVVTHHHVSETDVGRDRGPGALDGRRGYPKAGCPLDERVQQDATGIDANHSGGPQSETRCSCADPNVEHGAARGERLASGPVRDGVVRPPDGLIRGIDEDRRVEEVGRGRRAGYQVVRNRPARQHLRPLRVARGAFDSGVRGHRSAGSEHDPNVGLVDRFWRALPQPPPSWVSEHAQARRRGLGQAQLGRRATISTRRG